MRLGRIILCLPFTCLSWACATSSPVTPNMDTAVKAKAGLSARTLGEKECGLFVWTADAVKTFVLFSQNENQSVALWHEGQEKILTRQSQSGRPADGQFPEQTLMLRESSPVKLSLKQPDAIINGTRYKSGTLTTLDGAGWEIVTPVVGLAVCKNAPVFP